MVRRDLEAIVDELEQGAEKAFSSNDVHQLSVSLKYVLKVLREFLNKKPILQVRDSSADEAELEKLKQEIKHLVEEVERARQNEQ